MNFRANIKSKFNLVLRKLFLIFQEIRRPDFDVTFPGIEMKQRFALMDSEATENLNF